MKKCLIATSVIAVLAAGYVGCSWYTGEVIEKNFDNHIAQLTENLNSHSYPFKTVINYSNYEKGVFSTKLHLTVATTDKSDVAEDENFVESDQILFDDDVTIYHGPFPLPALAHGQFAPQMAWMDYTMTKSYSPYLWELAGNKPFITAYASMSYFNDFALNIKNSALSNADDEGNRFLISPGELNFKSHNDFSNIDLTINLDNVTFTPALFNEPAVDIKNWLLSVQQKEKKSNINYRLKFDTLTLNLTDFPIVGSLNLVLKDLLSQGTINPINRDIIYKLKMDNLYLKYGDMDNPAPGITLNQLALEQESHLQSSNLIEGSIKSSVGSFTYGKQELGSGHFVSNYQGIDYKELDLYNEFYSDLNLDNQASMQNSKKEIAKPFRIEINSVNWHNSAGDLNLSSTIELSDIHTFDIQNVDNIAEFSLNVDAPAKVIAQLATQWSQPDRNQVSKKEVASMENMIMMGGKILLSNPPYLLYQKAGVDGFFTTINYPKHGTDVEINGDKIDKNIFFNSVIEDDFEE